MDPGVNVSFFHKLKACLGGALEKRAQTKGQDFQCFLGARLLAALARQLL